MGKYDPLASFLGDLPDDQDEVELTFGRLDRLVGGLPPSSRRLRTWWANNSQGQSLAWHRSGWHVRTVDLAGSRVVFVRGAVGGSYAARGRTPTRSADLAVRPELTLAPAQIEDLEPANVETVDARVIFDWSPIGAAALDASGKLAFPKTVPATPGLYRLTLARASSRRRIYVGESDNLRRRLSTNYRNPGPRQRTSLRINALLIEHLRTGGTVAVDIAVSVTCSALGASGAALDLNRKAGRLLAESAALVLAQRTNDADIENLG